MTNEKATADKTTNGKTKTMAKLDIDKIIKQARAAYPKNEQGVALQISNGKTISRPQEGRDFICLPGENNWFKQVCGVPGISFGRFYEAFGRSNSGKSSIAMSFMKAAQDAGHSVILFDSEKKFSPSRYDDKMGGDSNNLFVVNTNSILDGIEGVAHLIHSIKENYPDQKILVVWDSLGASISNLEDSAETEKMSNQPGVAAKQVSFSIKKLAKLMNKYCNKETGEDSICVLICNQGYFSMGFGISVLKAKGGDTVEYFSSIILQLTRKKDLTRVKNGQKYRYGICSVIKILKNHLFDGNECLDSAEIVVSADGIQMADEVKSFEDIKGWDEEITE